MNTSLLRHFLFIVFCLAAPSLLADAASDRAEMQKRMNQETMDSEFAVEDSAKIDTYIQDAMKSGLKPKTTPPENWQSGYTCDSYYRRHYSYNYYGYRDCLYHHRYYGRYW